MRSRDVIVAAFLLVPALATPSAAGEAGAGSPEPEEARIAEAMRTEIRYRFREAMLQLHDAVRDGRAEEARLELARARFAQTVNSDLFDPSELSLFDDEVARATAVVAPLVRREEEARAEAVRRHHDEQLTHLRELRHAAVSSAARGRVREAWGIWQQVEVLDPRASRSVRWLGLAIALLLVAGTMLVCLARRLETYRRGVG